jgi:hypothetical protein
MNPDKERENFTRSKYSWNLQHRFKIDLGGPIDSKQIKDHILQRCQRKNSKYSRKVILNPTNIDVKFYIPSHGDASTIQQPRGQLGRVFSWGDKKKTDLIPAKFDMSREGRATLSLEMNRDNEELLKSWLRKHLHVGVEDCIQFYIYVNAECYLTIVIELIGAHIVTPDQNAVMPCVFQTPWDDTVKSLNIKIPDECKMWTIDKIKQSFKPPLENLPSEGKFGVLLEPRRKFHLRKLDVLTASWWLRDSGDLFFHLCQTKKLKQKFEDLKMQDSQFTFRILYQGSYLPPNVDISKMPESSKKDVEIKAASGTGDTSIHWRPLFSFLSDQLREDDFKGAFDDAEIVDASQGFPTESTKKVETVMAPPQEESGRIEFLLSQIEKEDSSVSTASQKILKKYNISPDPVLFSISESVFGYECLVKLQEGNKRWMDAVISLLTRKSLKPTENGVESTIRIRFMVNQTHSKKNETHKVTLKQIIPDRGFDPGTLEEVHGDEYFIKTELSEEQKVNLTSIYKRFDLKMWALCTEVGQTTELWFIVGKTKPGSVDENDERNAVTSTHPPTRNTLSSMIDDEVLESYMNYADVVSRLFDYPQQKEEEWKRMTDDIEKLKIEHSFSDDMKNRIEQDIAKHYPDEEHQTVEKPFVLRPFADRLLNAIAAQTIFKTVKN